MQRDRFRNFGPDGERLSDRLDTLDKVVFFAKFGEGTKAKRNDSFSFFVARDIDGNLKPVVRRIEFKRNPSLHKCDARCLNAKGHSCECSCGGANHGKGC